MREGEMVSDRNIILKSLTHDLGEMADDDVRYPYETPDIALENADI